MKKVLTLSLAATLMLGSCSTYQGSGAYAGATLGSMLGSAIGGIAGGPRGSDIGAVVGMAGGVAVGAALGKAADNANKRSEQYYEPKQYDDSYNRSYDNGQDEGRNYDRQQKDKGYDESGFDPSNSGDDTLYDFNGSDYTGSYTATQPQKVQPDNSPGIRFAPATHSSMPLEIRNARFVDDNQNHTLDGGELCKIIFEVYNVSQDMVSDVQPTVVESTGNKYISISSTIHVERIAPGKGVRYTAMVLARKRIKDGNANFRIYAVQGNGNVVSDVSEFGVPTRRK